MNTMLEPFESAAEMAMSFESDSTFGDKVRSDYQTKDTKIPISKYFSKTTKNVVLFTGEYMEVYISAKDIERKNAIIIGREIFTFGMFEMRIWDVEPIDAEKEKPSYITRYMFPSKIRTIPSSITKRTMSISGEAPDSYMVFGYRKNDVFIKNTVLAKSSANVSKFINNIFGAFITKLIAYDDLVPLVLECAALNGVSFNLNATTLELIFGAQARYSRDLTIPYRVFLNKRKKDVPLTGSEMTFVKIVDIPHITSTFTSFSFQNIDYAITVSSRRNRSGQKQTESSVEKIIKY